MAYVWNLTPRVAESMLLGAVEILYSFIFRRGQLIYLGYITNKFFQKPRLKPNLPSQSDIVLPDSWLL